MAESQEHEESKAFADLRVDYGRSELMRAGLDPDPLKQFEDWLQEAVNNGVEEPNAMTLSTVAAGGQPSSRVVLLKGLGLKGGAFHFYTNYESRKGRELAGNPRAALNFHWKPLERQVCVRGSVEKITSEDSDSYFQSRPYDSQIGAWVSEQSEEIPSREWLEQRREQLEKKFPEGEVPLPPFWGGYRLIPTEIEFWQGRPGRLHDRFLYHLNTDRQWQISRLSP